MAETERVYCIAMKWWASVDQCARCRTTGFFARCQGCMTAEEHAGKKMAENAKRVCTVCGMEMNRKTISGMCASCLREYRKNNVKVENCWQCGRQIMPNNTTGLCRSCMIHQKRYGDKVCLFPQCTNTVAKNTLFCRVHLPKYRKNRECSWPGCHTLIDERNRNGRCRKHFRMIIDVDEILSGIRNNADAMRAEAEYADNADSALHVFFVMSKRNVADLAIVSKNDAALYHACLRFVGERRGLNLVPEYEIEWCANLACFKAALVLGRCPHCGEVYSDGAVRMKLRETIEKWENRAK